MTIHDIIGLTLRVGVDLVAIVDECLQEGDMLGLQIYQKLQAVGGVDCTSIGGIVIVEVIQSKSRVRRRHNAREVLPAEVDIGILSKRARNSVVIATIDDPLNGTIFRYLVSGIQMSGVDEISIIQGLDAVNVKEVPRIRRRIRGVIVRLMRSAEWDLRRMIATAPREQDFIGGDVDLVEYAVQNPAVLGTSD